MRVLTGGVCKLIDERFEREIVRPVSGGPQDHRWNRNLQHVVICAPVWNYVGMFDQPLDGIVIRGKSRRIVGRNRPAPSPRSAGSLQKNKFFDRLCAISPTGSLPGFGRSLGLAGL